MCDESAEECANKEGLEMAAIAHYGSDEPQQDLARSIASIVDQLGHPLDTIVERESEKLAANVRREPKRTRRRKEKGHVAQSGSRAWLLD